MKMVSPVLRLVGVAQAIDSDHVVETRDSRRILNHVE
jgi:hypothetical protein